MGGIGFLVWNDVKEHRFRFRQYRLQSRIVLTASAVMILVPFLWFLFSEMHQIPVGERILPSLFQSVTLRTDLRQRTAAMQTARTGTTTMSQWYQENMGTK